MNIYFPGAFLKLLETGDNSNVFMVNGNTVWYIYTVKYYPVIKRTTHTHMDKSETPTLSKGSQTLMAKYYIILLHDIPEITKL